MTEEGNITLLLPTNKPVYGTNYLFYLLIIP